MITLIDDTGIIIREELTPILPNTFLYGLFDRIIGASAEMYYKINVEGNTLITIDFYKSIANIKFLKASIDFADIMLICANEEMVNMEELISQIGMLDEKQEEPEDKSV